MDNLTLLHKPLPERQQIAKAFYRQLSDLFVEHIKAISISPKKILRHITVLELNTIEPFATQNILLVSGHFGNWEWAAHALSLSIQHTIKAGYQPLHCTSINQIALYIRNRFGRKAMPMRTLLRNSLSHTVPPQAITLLVDQLPLLGGAGATFLGTKTAIDLTAARLAKKNNYPLFYIHITKVKRGIYHLKPQLLTSEPAKLSVQAIADLYTKQIEKAIFDDPKLWLWSHRRWKDLEFPKKCGKNV